MDNFIFAQSSIKFKSVSPLCLFMFCCILLTLQNLCQRKHLQNNAFYMFNVCSISCSFEETKHFCHAKSIETRWRSFPSSPGPTTNLVKVWVWTLWGNPELNCEHQSLLPPVNKTKNLSFCFFLQFCCYLFFKSKFSGQEITMRLWKQRKQMDATEASRRAWAGRIWFSFASGRSWNKFQAKEQLNYAP